MWIWRAPIPLGLQAAGSSVACAWREVPVSFDADNAARDTALAAGQPKVDEPKPVEPAQQRPLGRRVRALAARTARRPTARWRR